MLAEDFIFSALESHRSALSRELLPTALSVLALRLPPGSVLIVTVVFVGDALSLVYSLVTTSSKLGRGLSCIEPHPQPL